MQESEENVLLDQLKDILLREERKRRDDLSDDINEIREMLESYDKLDARLNPHLQAKVKDLQLNFDTYFGPQVTDALKNQISDSREEVIEALYPIIGKLIKKYIRTEIAILVEKVDRQVNNTFSLKFWRRKLKSWFSGADEKAMVIQELNKAEVKEIMVIQKESGLLIGSYSWNETIDQDMIGGMLTAIKSFAEDAFKQGNDELQIIQYESFNIVLHSFYSYYIAFAISGHANEAFKRNILDESLDFAEKNLKVPVKSIDNRLTEHISKQLKKQFHDFQGH